MEDQIIEDLTLLLLHLTSWEERIHEDLTIRRAWKGFRFEALDALEEAGYLNQSRGAKPVGARRGRDRAGAGLGSQVSG